MTQAADDEAELRRTIASEAADEAERNGSEVILKALKRHKDILSGGARVPEEDKALSERIFAEARTRSAEIRAAQRPSSTRLAAVGRPIPWWLILGWILAIAAAVVAWYVL